MQVPAHADDVYLCTGPNGVPEYRNSGNVKGCRKLSLPDVVTVPGTRSPRSGGGGAGRVERQLPARRQRDAEEP